MENRNRLTRASGAEVWVRDFIGHKKWWPRVMITSTGSLTCRVEVECLVLRCHVDHLLVRREAVECYMLHEGWKKNPTAV